MKDKKIEILTQRTIHKWLKQSSQNMPWTDMKKDFEKYQLKTVDFNKELIITALNCKGSHNMNYLIKSTRTANIMSLYETWVTSKIILCILSLLRLN
jgi:hypothetical protein